MYVINARNVNDAYVKGMELLTQHGEREETRNGQAMVNLRPVTTYYARPWERLLWNYQRNANPFFHLAESLWMLAGLNDATWLDQFVSDFSSRFAEADGHQHGAYGFRWRQHFDVEWGGGSSDMPDQLLTVVKLLQGNLSTRQAVLTMWDPVADLAKVKKDLPCNTHVYFRVRGPDELEREEGYRKLGISSDLAERNPDGSDYHLTNVVDTEKYLDITVCCRSNDIVWGAYGANAVHFSMLHEYIACRIGVKMGRYYQVSNNFHGYVNTLPQTWAQGDNDPYVVGVAQPAKVFTDPEMIDRDLYHFFQCWKRSENAPGFHNRFLEETAYPLLKLYAMRNELTQDQVFRYNEDHKTDWDLAACLWLTRRISKKEQRRG